jgi:hypothetical protein
MSLLEDRSPAAVISAIEANLIVLWRSYSRLPGAELCDQPDLLGVLQSSQMGYQLYRRLGFEDYCRIAIYLWPGKAERADTAHPG